MSVQTYENHVHQPVFTIVAAAFWAVSTIGFGISLTGRGWGATVGVAGLLLATLCLISISRVYTTRLQDRIIALEEQLRAERLLSPAQLEQWRSLGAKQIAALRSCQFTPGEKGGVAVPVRVRGFKIRFVLN